MNNSNEPQVNWNPNMMVEVLLNEPDDFLKVRETLTRIGVASRKEKKLYQSCHILHKQAKYYIEFAKIKQTYDVIYYENHAWDLKIDFLFLKDGI